MLTLVTGGARSGKSRHALEIVKRAERKVFVATAQAFDEEMRRRIERHREEREDSFLTIEQPLDLARALRHIPPNTDAVLIDCLTIWLNNVMHLNGYDAESYDEVESFLGELALPRPYELVIVANEVGLGLVPDTPLGRRFRDVAGEINQHVARLADQVLFMVSGLPLVVKGDSSP